MAQQISPLRLKNAGLAMLSHHQSGLGLIPALQPRTARTVLMVPRQPLCRCFISRPRLGALAVALRGMLPLDSWPRVHPRRRSDDVPVFPRCPSKHAPAFAGDPVCLPFTLRHGYPPDPPGLERYQDRRWCVLDCRDLFAPVPARRCRSLRGQEKRLVVFAVYAPASQHLNKEPVTDHQESTLFVPAVELRQPHVAQGACLVALLRGLCRDSNRHDRFFSWPSSPHPRTCPRAGT